MRMWGLIRISELRPLTNAEKQELQILFIRVAENDIRMLEAEIKH